MKRLPAIHLESHYHRAATLLAELPTHSDGIAEHLSRFNVQGDCGSPSRCALAEYFAEKIPLPYPYQWSVDFSGPSVDVDYGYAKDISNREFNEFLNDSLFSGTIVAFNTAVLNFIEKFDAGHYPHLIRKEA